MMDKIASDAYAQGAFEALQQMNVPGHIKEAAAQYLIKEAGLAQSAREGVGKLMDRLGEGRIAKGIRGLETSAKMKLPFSNKIVTNPKNKLMDMILGENRQYGVTRGTSRNRLGANPFNTADDLAAKEVALLERQIRAAKGIGATTGVGALGLGGAYGLGAFDGDEPAPEGWDSLSGGQQAALLGGGAAALGGIGYGINEMM